MRRSSRLATTDDARQGDEFSRFDFEFQFADDLLGMFRLKIPRLPEVPSKAVVILTSLNMVIPFLRDDQSILAHAR